MVWESESNEHSLSSSFGVGGGDGAFCWNWTTIVRNQAKMTDEIRVTWALHFEGAGKNSSFYNKYGTNDRDFRFIRKLQISWIYALQFWSLGKRPEMQTFVIFMDTSNFLPINYVSGYLHVHTTHKIVIPVIL